MLLLTPNLNDSVGLRLKFDGQSHSIDAKTLIQSLSTFVNVVNEVNVELNPENKIEIRINANEPGSFLVDVTLSAVPLASQLNQLVFNSDIISYAANLVEVVGGVYGLYKFLGGAKVESDIKSDRYSSDNSVQISDNKGHINYYDQRVVNIYQNNKDVKSQIGSGFQSLEMDENILGFQMLNAKNEPLFKAERNDFPLLAFPELDIENKKQRTIHRRVLLNIVSLSFEQKKQWEFVWENRTIKAKMSAKKFYEDIDKGEQFAKGDQLDAEMEILQKYDESIDQFLNKGYSIKTIHRHIPRSRTQSKLFPDKN